MMSNNDDDGDGWEQFRGPDAHEEIGRGARRERAQHDAQRPAQTGHSQAFLDSLARWLTRLVDGICEDISATPEGRREDVVNKGAYRIGKHLHLGINRDEAVRKLLAACEVNGWTASERGGENYVRSHINRSITHGEANPADTPNITAIHESGVDDLSERRRRKKSDDGEPSQRVVMTPMSAIEMAVPQWIWEYEGVGRIQHGTLCMFAGKPAAGKSTAARWFAARLSRGELDGVWHGTPKRVALMMFEEQANAIIKPGLAVAGANMENIFFPTFVTADNTEESFMSIQHEQRLTETLIDNNIQCLIVDPIMSAVGGKMDIHRNNETRSFLAPFTRIAQAINGVVIGVTHLRKGEVRDVLGGLHGSSAFGEVPRSVIGFAPITGGEHVVEQVKNSAGPTDLRLGYHMPVDRIELDTGVLELPRFEITGPTETSIIDIDSNNDETTDIAVACRWLEDYLNENPDTPSAQVKRDAKNNGDIKEHTLKRAKNKLDVRVTTTSAPGKPHMTVWNLPHQVR